VILDRLALAAWRRPAEILVKKGNSRNRRVLVYRLGRFSRPLAWTASGFLIVEGAWTAIKDRPLNRATCDDNCSRKNRRLREEH
jgi:hypothetical protein